VHYFKKPKTTQEKKWSEAHPEYVRAKRNRKNLPDYWDDLTRSDYGDRSWKKFRKKQWK